MRQRKVKNEEEKIARYNHWIVEEPTDRKGRWSEAFDEACDGAALCSSTAGAGASMGEREKDAATPELYLEIGCGKGKFITEMARRHPDRRYVAVEGAGTVVLRALEKAAGVRATILEDDDVLADGDDDGRDERYEHVGRDERAEELIVGEPLNNIRFITDYVQTLGDIFEKGEIRGIYLNFSDPWPKERHAKRRLTHRKYLTEYRKILSPGSILEFKSDNDDLFQFSAQEFYDFGLEILELTDDLHGVLTGPLVPTVVTDQQGTPVKLPGPGEGAALSAQVTTEYEDRFTEAGKNVHYCRVRF